MRKGVWGLVNGLLLLTFYSSNIAMAAIEQSDELLLLFAEDELVEIASGILQPLYKAPAVASVITAEDIKAIGASDISQLLETVPGLHVSTQFQVGIPLYTFRGMYTEFNAQVLIMVNGIPLNTLFTGSADILWKGMPVEAISRIEVIRGPGSAIYGADAFSGVINVITKTYDELEGTEVGVRLGSFSTEDAWLVASSKLNNLNVAFFLQYHNTSGHREIVEADAQTALDTLHDTNASLAPGPVSLSENKLDLGLNLSMGNWRLYSNLEYSDDIGAYAGVAQALDPEGRAILMRFSSNLTWHNPSLTDNWDVKAQLSFLENRQEMEEGSVIHLYPAGSAPFGDVTGDGIADPLPDGLINTLEHSEHHTRLELTSLYRGFNDHLIRFGMGWHLADLYEINHHVNYGTHPDTGVFVIPTTAGSPIFSLSDTPYAFLPEGDRENYHVYVQDLWQLDYNWDLTAGLRYDKFSDFGDTTNPRLALVWSVNEDFSAKLLYGEAFRSPSFTETSIQNNPAKEGNSNLKSETLQTGEAVFNYHPNRRFQLDLSLFRYDWQDMIQYVPDPVPSEPATAQNVGRQTGYGLEIATDWQVTERVFLQGNVAWQRSKDEESGDDAGNTPNLQTYLRTYWQFQSGWFLNAQANWVGERKRVGGDSRAPVDDYTTVDLTLRYAHAKKSWEAALISRNLFDDDVREPSTNGQLLPNDLPQAGRSVFGEIRYKF